MQINAIELNELLEAARRQGRVEASCDKAVGQPQNILPISSDELAKHIAEIGNKTSNKISAIKLFRTLTGMDLRDSKNYIERYWWVS